MDTIGIIAAIAGSGGLGALITSVFSRGKTKAETEAINNNIYSQTQDMIGKVYGDLIQDCRSQLTQQANQLNHQASQIQAMQDREVQYLKIIAGHQTTERELRAQIKQLESKLGDRIKSLEEQTQ